MKPKGLGEVGAVEAAGAPKVKLKELGALATIGVEGNALDGARCRNGVAASLLVTAAGRLKAANSRMGAMDGLPAFELRPGDALGTRPKDSPFKPMAACT